MARFLVGVLLGGGAFAGYLASVGAGDVAGRIAELPPWAVAVVVLLVVGEGLADGIGVWASVNPLGRGLSKRQSVQFAMAGDFFDTLSPAGPVSSEPIMAQFIGVTTETSYADALAVRGVAKYVKSGAQLLLSTVLALSITVGGSSPRFVLVTLAGAVGTLLVGGLVVLRFRAAVSRAVVAVAAPVVAWASSLYRDDPHDRAVVASAVERFWARVLLFRDRPGLVALVAVGGVVEQVLTAAALYVALLGIGSGTGAAVALLPHRRRRPPPAGVEHRPDSGEHRGVRRGPRRRTHPRDGGGTRGGGRRRPRRPDGHAPVRSLRRRPLRRLSPRVAAVA
nr:lysylphosphatidylglycerol synthase domain-containing protein [Halogeometricum sp. CBA1124]